MISNQKQYQQSIKTKPAIYLQSFKHKPHAILNSDRFQTSIRNIIALPSHNSNVFMYFNLSFRI